MKEYYFFLVLALFITAFAHLSYKKYYIEKKRLWYVVTILSFIMASFCGFMSLRGLSIDIVYLSTSFTMIIISVFSKIWLKENITKNKIFGSFFIVLGIIIYAVSE
ncbi:MAG: EamA family transporter [Spirochaetia bacterium]|nr:EamA family transporter [Spirochaetia bacterium]